MKLKKGIELFQFFNESLKKKIENLRQNNEIRTFEKMF